MNSLKNRNVKGELVKPADYAAELNMSYGSVVRLAKEAGAFLKIGRMAFIDPVIFDRYVHENFTVKD